MPSQRKRIGFLPREEVQIIIDEICKHNKLSQSKVTGILVEQGLYSKGLLKSSQYNRSYKDFWNKINFTLVSDDSINNQTDTENDNLNLDETNINVSSKFKLSFSLSV